MEKFPKTESGEESFDEKYKKLCAELGISEAGETVGEADPKAVEALEMQSEELEKEQVHFFKDSTKEERESFLNSRAKIFLKKFLIALIGNAATIATFLYIQPHLPHRHSSPGHSSTVPHDTQAPAESQPQEKEEAPKKPSMWV
jgi:hypothetical protein